MYSYYYYYDMLTAMPIAVLVAIILGVAFYFTFLKKENEDKFTGWKKVVYDFFSFNKFYTEDIMKLVYVMLTAALVVIGVFMLFIDLTTALILLVLGNVALRVSYELIMMFVILCRKTVSIDRKLDKVVAFYGDDFDEGDCSEEEFSCGGECGSCDADCGDREDEFDMEDEEEVITLSCGGCGVDDEEPSTCGGNCSGCSVEGCGGLQEEDEEKEEVEETEEVESEEKVEE